MCLQLGIDDPEAWLDAASDEQLALWQAFDRIEPIGRDWERHAAAMSMIDGLYALTLNVNVPDNEYKPRQLKDFLPPGYMDPTEKIPFKKQMAAMAKIAGNKYGNHN